MNTHQILTQLQAAYHDTDGLTPPDQAHLPLGTDIQDFLDDCKEVLFPSHAPSITEDTLLKLAQDLQKALTKVVSETERITNAFLTYLPQLRKTLATDAIAHFEGDPAAQSLQEVLLAYPGFAAIVVHRIAHFFYTHQVPLLPRLMSELSHTKTGIDIHPGAQIGDYFCIDHGTGIVIGETSLIGQHVKLYQGVTLGALSVAKNLCASKRHPTIQDHVTIYSGTTILGGETIIGHHTTIGGNVWITASVPAKSKVYLSSDKRQVTKTELITTDANQGFGI
jgi:serine O-acetyltransferase